MKVSFRLGAVGISVYLCGLLLTVVPLGQSFEIGSTSSSVFFCDMLFSVVYIFFEFILCDFGNDGGEGGPSSSVSS